MDGHTCRSGAQRQQDVLHSWRASSADLTLRAPRKRPRIKALLAAVVGATLALSLVVGCTPTGGSSGQAPSAGAGKVDPQVFGDVVEWAMPLPGSESQSRGRRITNFMDNLRALECEATPAPLDYIDDTSGNQFPELDLIRERGLPPIYNAMKYYKLKRAYGGDLSPECAALERLCSKVNPTPEELTQCRAERERLHPRSMALLGAMTNAVRVAATWQDDTILTVSTLETVLDLARPTAQCLRDGSGLDVTDDKPSDSFLGSVDVAYFEKGSKVSTDTMWQWSKLYADCSEPYFDAIEHELAQLRPALVERHREVLEEFAAQLVELGYVP